MTVEIPICILTNLHEQFFVIHGSHEFDTLILIEVCLFLQLFQELVTHIGDKREITLGMALHEFANHGFIIVFRHEASDNQIIGLW